MGIDRGNVAREKASIWLIIQYRSKLLRDVN